MYIYKPLSHFNHIKWKMGFNSCHKNAMRMLTKTILAQQEYFGNVSYRSFFILPLCNSLYFVLFGILQRGVLETVIVILTSNLVEMVIL